MTRSTIRTLSQAVARAVAALTALGHQPRWLVVPGWDRQTIRTPIRGDRPEQAGATAAFWCAIPVTIELAVSGYIIIDFQEEELAIDGHIPGPGGQDLFPQFLALYNENSEVIP